MHHTTDHQLDALKVLMADPDNIAHAVTLTGSGDLHVRINREREFLIDRDGTVIELMFTPNGG